MDKEKNRILSSQSTLSLISEVRNKNKDKINYIGSLSFEDRDLVGIKCILNTEWISSILKHKRIYFNVFYLIDTCTCRKKVIEHKKNITKFLENRDIKSYYFIECDFHNPREVLDKLLEIDGELVVRYTYLDMSTLTRNLGSYLMKAFQYTSGEIIYFEPMEYGKNLSQGLEKKDYFPDLGRNHDPSKEDVLIIFTGHELERAHLLAEDVDPDKVILMVPRGDDTDNHAKWNGHARKVGEELACKLPLRKDSIEIRYTPSHGYQTILCDLGKIIADFPQEKYNISFASMGTKISNLALNTATSTIEGLCVYDAVPENYNVEDYSKGVRIKNPYSFPLRIDDRIKTY